MRGRRRLRAGLLDFFFRTGGRVDKTGRAVLRRVDGLEHRETVGRADVGERQAVDELALIDLIAPCDFDGNAQRLAAADADRRGAGIPDAEIVMRVKPQAAAADVNGFTDRCFAVGGLDRDRAAQAAALETPCRFGQLGQKRPRGLRNLSDL